MGAVTLLKNNFASGQLAPTMEGRIDSPRYFSGVRSMVNALPTPTGTVQKRPGSRYLGNTQGSAKARFFTFVASDGTYFFLEFTNNLIRIWDSTLALTGATVVTTYTLAQLPSLRLKCYKGEAWITHPSHPPRKLTYSSPTWTLSAPTFTAPATIFGAFGSANYYPRTVGFCAGRLAFGSWPSAPTSIGLSRAPDAASGANRFTDFTLGTNSGDGIYLEDSDISGTKIAWMVAMKRMAIATDRSVWVDNGQGITPAAFDGNVNNYNGSADMDAAVLHDLIVYAGRDLRSMWALAFNTSTSDTTVFKPICLSMDTDVLDPGIVDFCVQEYPYPILWVVLADGTLASCVIQLDAGVLGWSTHDVGGLVESASVGSGSDKDVLILSVNRSGTRTVEAIYFQDLESTAQEDFFFVDAGKTVINGSPSATLSGLSHLEGKTVVAMADGSATADFTVASGAVTLDYPVSKAQVGLHVESIIETLRPETPANGTSQGKNKRILRITQRLYKTLGGKAKASSSDTYTELLYITAGSYTWGNMVDLFTGDISTEEAANLDPQATIVLEHDTPAPYNLLALIFKVEILEP